MCRTCGCSPIDAIDAHTHAHDRPHAHVPLPGAVHGDRMRRVERALLERNDRIAADNRHWFADRGIVALNLVSSPGAGKTTLLERMIRELRDELPIAVIEGDQATDVDAQRIRAAGAPAVQVNTGAGCHLDAAMVARALAALDPAPGSLVVIENVGNLVCPALFDLGEHAKILIASVTEGEDKPVKYPHMFRAAHAALLNKVDLLPHVAFAHDRWLGHARVVNPRLVTFAMSATRGDGLPEWLGWIRDLVARRSRPGAR